MTVKLTHELLVCECCLCMVANDERCHCPSDEHPDGLAAFKDIPDLVHLVADGEEMGFMHYTLCAGCGSDLSGDRYRVVGLTSVREG